MTLGRFARKLVATVLYLVAVYTFFDAMRAPKRHRDYFVIALAAVTGWAGIEIWSDDEEAS